MTAPSTPTRDDAQAALDRRKTDRRTGERRGRSSEPTGNGHVTAPARQDRRGTDRRTSDRRRNADTGSRLVSALVPYMRAQALTQSDLAAHLDLSEADLLDLAWRPIPPDAISTERLAQRYGTDGAKLTAILSARA